MFRRFFKFFSHEQKSSPISTFKVLDNSYLSYYLKSLPKTKFISFLELKRNLEFQGFLIRSIPELAFRIVDLVRSEEFGSIEIQKEFLPSERRIVFFGLKKGD